MFFVWERNFAGRPVPHIAPVLPMDYARGKPKPILASHRLSDAECVLPFSILERLFPPPQVSS